MLVLASAVILRAESHGTYDNILLSQIRASLNLRARSLYLRISPMNRVARLYPQALGCLFVASYDSQGYGAGSTPKRFTMHMDRRATSKCNIHKQSCGLYQLHMKSIRMRIVTRGCNTVKYNVSLQTEY
jgi:hypothetical protein